jgi:FtsZ-interacting cell division protein ZipA
MSAAAAMRLTQFHSPTDVATLLIDSIIQVGWPLGQREMFVRLEHPAGNAQAAFGEAQVVMAA